MKLLTESNTKTLKGLAQGWRVATLQLLPDRMADAKRSVCPWSTPACRACCLVQSGHGVRHAVFNARRERTVFFHTNRPRFIEQLRKELRLFVKRCAKSGHKPAVRLNCFSDIPWERLHPQLFADFPGIQFYDYTKSMDRIEIWGKGLFPKNYHLTASWTELDTPDTIERKLRAANLAVPFFSDVPVGEVFHGAPIVDGDVHDLTFLHGTRGKVLGLVFKGKGGSRPTAGLFGVYQTTTGQFGTYLS